MMKAASEAVKSGLEKAVTDNVTDLIKNYAADLGVGWLSNGLADAVGKFTGEFGAGLLRHLAGVQDKLSQVKDNLEKVSIKLDFMASATLRSALSDYEMLERLLPAPEISHDIIQGRVDFILNSLAWFAAYQRYLAQEVENKKFWGRKVLKIPKDEATENAYAAELIRGLAVGRFLGSIPLAKAILEPCLKHYRDAEQQLIKEREPILESLFSLREKLISWKDKHPDTPVKVGRKVYDNSVYEYGGEPGPYDYVDDMMKASDAIRIYGQVFMDFKKSSETIQARLNTLRAIIDMIEVLVH